MNVKKLIFLFATVILIVATCLWYRSSIYPFGFSKKVFWENEMKLNEMVDYFKSYHNIYSAEIDIDGKMQIVSSEGMNRFDCSSDTGYQTLQFLREKYIDDKADEYNYQSYMLNFIKAKYDDADNMTLEIPVYARILKTDGNVNSPNRIVYYLVYRDKNYSKDDINIKEESAINDTWFIASKSLSAG